MVNGIHAMGGMGLKISKIGRNNAETGLNQPIRIPRTMPAKEPITNPTKTRLKLQTICPSMVWVPTGFTMETKNIFNVSMGPAKTIPAFVKLTTICQTQRKTAMAIMAQIVFS